MNPNHIIIKFFILLIQTLQLVKANNKTFTINKPPIELRIINGNNVSPPEAPFMVSLFIKENQQSNQGLTCGGTLVNAQTILTAAHCFQGNEKISGKISAVDIFLNRYKSAIKYGYRPDFSSTQFVVHPEYSQSSNGNQNDIALVFIDKNVENDQKYLKFYRSVMDGPFNLSSLFVGLPSYSEKVPEKTSNENNNNNNLCVIYGWGTLAENCNNRPDTLQKANLPIADFNFCQTTYGKTILTSPEMFCAGYFQGGVDACQGDSGGPLLQTQVQSGSEKSIQLGIVSFGVGCGRPLFPGVYTNVAYYRRWIDDSIAKNVGFVEEIEEDVIVDFDKIIEELESITTGALRRRQSFYHMMSLVLTNIFLKFIKI